VFMVYGLEFRVEDLRFIGFGVRDYGVGFRV
jgi:hypothetical protein